MCQVIKIAILSLLSSTAFALSSDRLEKIHITAHSTNYNYKTGLTVYEGQVTVDQGTTHITADRLVTKTNMRHYLQEAIAYGDSVPAHYWTAPKAGDTEMHAHAKIIKFNPIGGTVSLEQQVTVTQGENSFQGELILYNRNDQTIFVPPNKGRAVIVYNPDQNSK